MIGTIKPAIAQTYALAKPYWTSEEKRRAWALLSAMLLLQFIKVYIDALLTYAMADIIDAMDLRDFNNVLEEFAYFAAILIAALLIYIVELDYRYRLTINWRRHLTDKSLKDYFAENTFNQLELSDYDIDNPDQRISADINNFVTQTLELGRTLLVTVIRFVTFSYILWTVSGHLALPIAGREITVPGYMFWTAIIYAAFFTWIVHLAGRPLIPLKFDQQKVEADFRFHLTRVREHSDSVALASGGGREREDFKREFSLIKSNWLHLLKYERRLLGFTLGFSHLTMILPFLAAVPALMAGTVALGGVVQLRSAFSAVVMALSWLARAYSRVADWKASVDRIVTLNGAIKQADLDLSSSSIDRIVSAADRLCVTGLTLKIPSGDTLFERQSFQIMSGQTTVITGPSGSGKSTLFRAIAGQWIWGDGRIELPPGKLEFIPQTPYLPKGDLGSILAYPSSTDDFSSDELANALNTCDLPHLANKLREIEDWARSLSGGEKQRLAIARVLLSRPDWLFMDEATSALDSMSEANIVKTLSQHLSNTTVVSISHREPLHRPGRMHLHLDRDNKSITLL